MKNIFTTLLFLVCCFSFTAALSQDNGIQKSDSAKVYVITKNDGTQFIGRIISQDAREVLVDTKEMGRVIIPKHEIREIKELQPGDMGVGGTYIPEETFATRYFISTNALPIKKGESYIQWNLFGPDFQFGVGKNFGLGVMTTWFGAPVIGSAKYSFELDKNVNIAVGTLLGTGSWSQPGLGIALPFGAFTLGNRRTNISFSAGYGAIVFDGESSGQSLFSVSGMVKVGRKVSLVFESLIVPEKCNLILPGIRVQTQPNRAFQFGFGRLAFNDGDDDFVIPIPMVVLYQKL